MDSVQLFESIATETLNHKDYDTFITFYTCLLNKHIEQDLDTFRKEINVEEIPLVLNSVQARAYASLIDEWMRTKKGEWTEFVNTMVGFIESSGALMEKTPGLLECMLYIGQALIEAALCNKSSLYKFNEISSKMLLLCDEEFRNFSTQESIDQARITKAFLFIKEKHISIPYYYVLLKDMYAIGCQEQYLANQWNTTNRIRAGKIIQRLPDIFLDLCIGDVSFFEKEDIIYESFERVAIYTNYIYLYNYIPHLQIGKDIQTEYNSVWTKRNPKNKRLAELIHPFVRTESPKQILKIDVDPEYLMFFLANEATEYELRKQTNSSTGDNAVGRGLGSIKFLPGLATIIGTSTYSLSKDKDAGSDALPAARVTVGGTVGMGAATTLPALAALAINKLEDKKSLVNNWISQSLSDELITEMKASTESLNEVFLKLVKEKKLKINAVCNDAIYDKRTYERFRKGKTPHNKDAIIALAIAMGLNDKETDRLLYSAGYVLSTGVYRDILIRKLIEKGNMSVPKVNIILQELGFSVLASRIELF